MRYDRDNLLARTDLAALADDLLGWHLGHGRNARWPSPVPDHPQTGRTPPMSIFTDRRGVERWTCFATGTGGTAIDLVTVATGRRVAEAMAWLADRVQLQPETRDRVPPRPRPGPAPEPPVVPPSDALRTYVDSCARILWQPAGERIRRWLIDERRLDPDVLRLNRVGADPGPGRLPRPTGLPRQGPAAVFPALDDAAQPVYLQARYLHPPTGRGKYDNPTSAHGSNSRLAMVEPACPNDGPTIVAEGVPDALTAAGVGYRAIAVLGAALPDRRVAERIAKRAGLLVLAFDADQAGRTGSGRLRDLLAHAGRTDVIDIVPPVADINTWAIDRGAGAFTLQLRMAIGLAASGRGRGQGRSIA